MPSHPNSSHHLSDLYIILSFKNVIRVELQSLSLSVFLFSPVFFLLSSCPRIPSWLLFFCLNNWFGGHSLKGSLLHTDTRACGRPARSHLYARDWLFSLTVISLWSIQVVWIFITELCFIYYYVSSYYCQVMLYCKEISVYSPIKGYFGSSHILALYYK